MAALSRRQFLSASGLACASAAMPLTASAKSSCEALPTISHNVYFWLKRSDSTTDRAQLIAGLKSLAAIPQIKALHIGVPASTEQRDVIDSSYQVSELMMFESVEDQNSYQSHPIHIKFVEQCAHLWDRVVVYDSKAV